MRLASMRRAKGDALRAMIEIVFGKSKNMKRLGLPPIGTCRRPALSGGYGRWFANARLSHVRQPVWLAD
jgi:hypothetical protein